MDADPKESEKFCREIVTFPTIVQQNCSIFPPPDKLGADYTHFAREACV